MTESKQKMEHKTFAFDLTGFDYEGRTFEGYAAAFGNIDAVGDIIHQGAFTKTLAERGNKVKLLWQHNTAEPIGRPVFLQEDQRGLFVRAIISDTARGRDALALLRDRAISEMSIGYDSIKGGTDYTTTDNGETIRNLRELRLWEVSIVSFPANENARITALKEDDKAVSGSTGLPLASRERGWDAGAARKRVATWAGADDAPSAKYRRAFFWYDAGNADKFGAYKLPFADVVDGKLMAIPRGIFAVAGALGGARTPLQIPASDVAGIRRKVASYYSRMRSQFDDDSLVPPWDKATEDDMGEKLEETVDAEPVDEVEAPAADDEKAELADRNALLESTLSTVLKALADAGIELVRAEKQVEDEDEEEPDSEDEDEEEEKADDVVFSITTDDVKDKAPGETQAAEEEEQEQDRAQAGPADGGDADESPTSSKDEMLTAIDIELQLLEVVGDGKLP